MKLLPVSSRTKTLVRTRKNLPTTTVLRKGHPDVHVPGYQLLVDDEIIANVIDNQGPCDDEEEPRFNDRTEKGSSSEEACHCLETTMKWLEQ
ncbi:hypothetical protein AVEN_1563-1 [Araneus ventricosus]|uniref:Uncharacterized protein n=1 Tax=Araneus ventricosus TaxID=182803 RepID=A0A4Y2DT98_ARAVE|nr:hypothetical protein AVEN_1563-1 [Araneus ventricosus]